MTRPPSPASLRRALVRWAVARKVWVRYCRVGATAPMSRESVEELSAAEKALLALGNRVLEERKGVKRG